MRQLLLWLCLASGSPLTSPSHSVALHVGQEVVLEFPGATRVSVGDPAVGDVHVSSAGEVVLVGKGVGRTTLVVWQGGAFREMQVEVTERRAEDLAIAIHGLGGCEGLEVESVNGKLLVTGRLESLSAYRDLQHLLEGDPSVVLMIEVNHQVRLDLVAQINRELDKAGIKTARARQVGDRIFLEGEVEDESDRVRAQKIAEAIAGQMGAPPP